MGLLQKLLGVKEVAKLSINVCPEDRTSIFIQHSNADVATQATSDVHLFCWYYALVLYVLGHDHSLTTSLYDVVRQAIGKVIDETGLSRPTFAGHSVSVQPCGTSPIGTCTATLYSRKNGSLYLNGTLPLTGARNIDVIIRSVVDLLQLLVDSLPERALLFLVYSVTHMHLLYSEGVQWTHQKNTNEVPTLACTAGIDEVVKTLSQ